MSKKVTNQSFVYRLLSSIVLPTFHYKCRRFDKLLHEGSNCNHF